MVEISLLDILFFFFFLSNICFFMAKKERVWIEEEFFLEGGIIYETLLIQFIL